MNRWLSILLCYLMLGLIYPANNQVLFKEKENTHYFTILGIQKQLQFEPSKYSTFSFIAVEDEEELQLKKEYAKKAKTNNEISCNLFFNGSLKDIKICCSSTAKFLFETDNSPPKLS